MGAGGVIPPPRTYWEKIQAVCRKHDVLIVADEVITGFGRTGNMFGCQTYDISPDFMVVSKALTSSLFPAVARSCSPTRSIRRWPTTRPRSACSAMASPPAAIRWEPRSRWRISTSSRSSDLVGAARRLAPQFQERLRSFASHPLVGEARGVGLIGALEFVADKATKAPFDPPGSLRREARRTLPRGRPDHPRDRRHHRLLPAADHHVARDRRDVRSLRPRAEAAAVARHGQAAACPPPSSSATVIIIGRLHDARGRRPTSETIDGVASWLRGAARREASLAKVIDEFAWRLTAAGIGLLRVSLNSATLHPQFLGATYLWWRDIGETREADGRHEVARYRALRQQSGAADPRRRTRSSAARLDVDPATFDFSVLADFKERGGADYLACRSRARSASSRMSSPSSPTRPAASTQAEIDLQTPLAGRRVIADMRSQRQIAENVLAAYLGAQLDRGCSPATFAAAAAKRCRR